MNKMIEKYMRMAKPEHVVKILEFYEQLKQYQINSNMTKVPYTNRNKITNLDNEIKAIQRIGEVIAHNGWFDTSYKDNDGCSFYIGARDQYISKLAEGKGTIGTTGYRERGCFDCDGKKFDCKAFYIKKNKNKKK